MTCNVDNRLTDEFFRILEYAVEKSIWNALQITYPVSSREAPNKSFDERLYETDEKNPRKGAFAKKMELGVLLEAHSSRVPQAYNIS